MGKKVFLDVGAHTGESLEFFRNNWPDHAEYEIHCFEPNPEHHHLFDNEDVTLHKEAVWTEDGFRDFYIGKFPGGMAEGSTLMQKKISGKVDYNNPINVPVIDFARWMHATFSKEDYIVLKVDIEGAEYAVLHHLMDTGIIEYVDRLYGELHSTGPSGRIQSVKEGEDMRLLERLQKYGLAVLDWHNNVNPNAPTA